MTDEAYVFKSEVAERKAIARSASKKKGRGGRYVRLPSDNLTAKEKKEMNGKMATFYLDRPHTYQELNEMPIDMQKEYLERVLKEYKPSLQDLAKMLRRDANDIRNLLKELNVSMPARTRRNKVEQFNWRVFIGDVMPYEIMPPEPEPVKVEPEPVPVMTGPQSVCIGNIDHISMHVKGKPMAVAQGIPLLLDLNKNYYFSINIHEIAEKPEEIQAGEELSPLDF